jgi:hypothetical protein
MTTVAINQQAIRSYSLPSVYNKYSLVSVALAVLFVLYFLVPHVGVLSSVLSFSMFFLVILPLIAFALSLVALRQIMRTHDRGIILSYIALGITSLYFMVALAVPVVIVGCYILYSYVL